jgi:2-keto-4-pentenoate hydratase
MHSQDTIDTIAGGFIEARRNGRLWAPAAYQPLSAADAYAVQDRVGAALGWFAQDRPAAWKAGAPNRSAEPTAAPLPSVLQSGAQWPCAGWHGLGVEAEIAFRLGKTPSSKDDILHCIATMCVSIEICATRLADVSTAPAEWKLADQQSHADLVIGPEIPFAAREWDRQRCIVEINGAVAAEAEGSHPCADPLWPLPWLAKHAAARGKALRAGDLITTGSWVGILPVKAGDRVSASFDGIGSVQLQLAP